MITVSLFLMLLFIAKGIVKDKEVNKMESNNSVAIFAGGCFWCMEPPYKNIDGVIDTKVGYIGGSIKNPTYEEISTGTTGHAEAVKITFNPQKVTYKKLLEADLDVFNHNIETVPRLYTTVRPGARYFASLELLKNAKRFNNKIFTKSGIMVG